eukprot:scaffold147728_cov27-Tisochrysis_lutea.AAC.2
MATEHARTRVELLDASDAQVRPTPASVPGPYACPSASRRRFHRLGWRRAHLARSLNRHAPAWRAPRARWDVAFRHTLLLAQGQALHSLKTTLQAEEEARQAAEATARADVEMCRRLISEAATREAQMSEALLSLRNNHSQAVGWMEVMQRELKTIRAAAHEGSASAKLAANSAAEAASAVRQQLNRDVSAIDMRLGEIARSVDEAKTERARANGAAAPLVERLRRDVRADVEALSTAIGRLKQEVRLLPDRNGDSGPTSPGTPKANGATDLRLTHVKAFVPSPHRSATTPHATEPIRQPMTGALTVETPGSPPFISRLASGSDLGVSACTIQSTALPQWSVRTSTAAGSPSMRRPPAATSPLRRSPAAVRSHALAAPPTGGAPHTACDRIFSSSSTRPQPRYLS